MAAHEVIDPYFLLYSSACWNGLALGTIDVAKKHVSRTEHADSGLRVADYPIIQVRDHVLLTMLVKQTVALRNVSCFLKHAENSIIKNKDE